MSISQEGVGMVLGNFIFDVWVSVFVFVASLGVGKKAFAGIRDTTWRAFRGSR